MATATSRLVRHLRLALGERRLRIVSGLVLLGFTPMGAGGGLGARLLSPFSPPILGGSTSGSWGFSSAPTRSLGASAMYRSS